MSGQRKIIQASSSRDNFFQPPKWMDLPCHLHDCYYFYYSNCLKMESCRYRHEVAALGHEIVCQRWLQGDCWDRKCTNRHMFIPKKRCDIACYWEPRQTVGCVKPHCPFKHIQPRPWQQQHQEQHLQTAAEEKSMLAIDRQRIEHEQQWQHQQIQQQLQLPDVTTTSSMSMEQTGVGRGGDVVWCPPAQTLQSLNSTVNDSGCASMSSFGDPCQASTPGNDTAVAVVGPEEASGDAINASSAPGGGSNKAHIGADDEEYDNSDDGENGTSSLTTFSSSSSSTLGCETVMLDRCDDEQKDARRAVDDGVMV